MTSRLPDDGIRDSEFDHDQGLISHDHFEDEPRAWMGPGARHENSGSRWHPEPVEVPDVAE